MCDQHWRKLKGLTSTGSPVNVKVFCILSFVSLFFLKDWVFFFFLSPLVKETVFLHKQNLLQNVILIFKWSHPTEMLSGWKRVDSVGGFAAKQVASAPEWAFQVAEVSQQTQICHVFQQTPEISSCLCNRPVIPVKSTDNCRLISASVIYPPTPAPQPQSRRRREGNIASASSHADENPKQRITRACLPVAFNHVYPSRTRWFHLLLNIAHQSGSTKGIFIAGWEYRLHSGCCDVCFVATAFIYILAVMEALLMWETPRAWYHWEGLTALWKLEMASRLTATAPPNTLFLAPLYSEVIIMLYQSAPLGCFFTFSSH